MEYWLLYIAKKSLFYSIFAIIIVSFLESLAIVGLLIPGIIMMAGLGTLIGNGNISFYQAWTASTIGCFIGDWISYYIGWKFKAKITKFNFLKKYEILIKKTIDAIHKHSMITIITGRFIGPTRPVIPMIAGMLKLPIKRFILPSIIGCILWPPLYFMPGIFTIITVNLPNYNSQNYMFKWSLIIVTLISWLSIWLTWKWWKIEKDKKNKKLSISLNILRCITPISIILSIIGIINIKSNPQMLIFGKILYNILI
ncbi:DedA family protein [Buchnera aphidicola (Neophyllaphis podocarpi)]|uniref:DedA family protein n=1 Tax=Buchnera aphidicola TaxID=9 RepID=UPI0031B83ECB